MFFYYLLVKVYSFQMPYIIVVEDDFIFNENISVDEFYNVLDIITSNSDKYEIFNGSPTFWDQRNSIHCVKKYKSFNDDFNLITNGHSGLIFSA